MSKPATIVLGLGVSGFSCVRYLCAPGAHASEPRQRVLAIDTRPEPPFLGAVRSAYPEVEILAAGELPSALALAGRVVVSPGVALDHCLVRMAKAAGVTVSSDIELFLAAANAPVVGITGTNGKSTVTALVSELLGARGLTAPAGGNLGTPALDLLADGVDAYVLELSSFQLERLDTPSLDVAAILNITIDHQDRYPNAAAYAAAKRRIYRGAASAVYNANDSATVPSAGFKGRRIALNADRFWRVDDADLVIAGQRLGLADIALQGRHNHFNALAAAAIAYQIAPASLETARGALRQALGGGLPHRSAVVTKAGGVAFINDSKATNVGATLAALEGFGTGERNIVLIAGGDAKGASFEALAPAVVRHVSHVVLIGRDAGLVEVAFAGCAAILRAVDMREAVRLAIGHARAGQTVLLSPACASFDRYANYQARGDDFAACVKELLSSGGADAGGVHGGGTVGGEKS